MKYPFILLVFFSMKVFAQQQSCENIIIITTDGYRWQELFNGADSAILFDEDYVNDIAIMRSLYWDSNVNERRKKLMPFTWNYLETHGQIWGNRKYENEVSVTNPYHLSYAGYNEIFTGYADSHIMTNREKNNSNVNVLGFLNLLPQFKDKVAMFGSWKLFACILNGTSDKILLNTGYQNFEEDTLSPAIYALNKIQQAIYETELPVRSDMLTFTMATEYIKAKHPRVVHIAFGETDEFAHRGRYDKYLEQANQFDKFVSGIWSMLQEDVFYKDKTTLFITTDHGRGRKRGKWIAHGPFIAGSGETWMMQVGPGIKPLGEIKVKARLYNDQFAQTIANYLGENFIAKHPVADAPQLLVRY